MAKWKETKSTKYGGKPPNYAKQAQAQAEVDAAHKRFLLKMRIGGIITALIGMGLIGLSIFTAVKCLFIGIMVMAVGLAVLWSTETAF